MFDYILSFIVFTLILIFLQWSRYLVIKWEGRKAVDLPERCSCPTGPTTPETTPLTTTPEETTTPEPESTTPYVPPTTTTWQPPTTTTGRVDAVVKDR